MEDAYVPIVLMRHNRPLRGVMIDRQPWVCAWEFARLLGHRHPERICRLMDDDQVRTVMVSRSASVSPLPPRASPAAIMAWICSAVI